MEITCIISELYITFCICRAFNLTTHRVTSIVFQPKSLVLRKDQKIIPIQFGAVLLHVNADIDTYVQFLMHLKLKFRESNFKYLPKDR